MPSDDKPVELQDLGLQVPELTAESRKTGAGHFREPVVSWIGDDFQQVLNPSAPDGSNDPELGKTA
jgi:hypothetical protein